MRVMRSGILRGQIRPVQEVTLVPPGEGRWPRICERVRAARTLAVRCDHVL